MAVPDLVLAIEEPELYQHPNRQRHIADILLRLASRKTPGVADTTQILYSTHSPLFVGIDRIGQMRLLRKCANGKNKPKVTRVVQTSLDDAAEEIWVLEGKAREQYTGATLHARLQSIMTPWMSEGFFAGTVVLVEGEDDRAALVGAAKAMGLQLEAKGVAVIPCCGKRNIDRPAVIFRRLGIPTYIIWDGDKHKAQTEGKCKTCGRRLDAKADPRDNHRLLQLVGRQPEDWPAYVEDTFACFETDLEDTIRQEIGVEIFEKRLQDCKKSLGISEHRHALKNATVISDIIKQSAEDGRASPTLEKVVHKIVALSGGSPAMN